MSNVNVTDPMTAIDRFKWFKKRVAFDARFLKRNVKDVTKVRFIPFKKYFRQL